MRSDPPLVSCIMPTHDRRRFVPRAIRQFLEQDYPHRELVIVDDGTDPVADLVPDDDPRVRYLRQSPRMSLGAKRNLACRESRGDVVVHWDDDDWMAPWRLSYQVRSLVHRRAEVCGLSRMLFYDPQAGRAWRYVYPRGGRKWLAGGSLCYLKDLWRRRPFDSIDVGEDNRFVWRTPSPRLLDLEDESFYVALVHPANTSRKRTSGSRWQPYPVAAVRRLVGEEAAPAPPTADFCDPSGVKPRGFA